MHPAYAGATRDSLVSVNGTDYLQAALVFMDPRTGDVRALIGGRDYHDSQFNRAFNANRQMASTFKPFVFAAAIAAGYPSSLRLSDQPLRSSLVGRCGRRKTMMASTTTLSPCVRRSPRRATSPRSVWRTWWDSIVLSGKHNSRNERPFPSAPSVVLGAVEATPLELTTAYATFATLGKRPQSRLVTRVLDANGKVLWQQRPITKAALDPSVAFMVNDMLKDVIDSGTAMPLRHAGYRGVVAGKTGTSNGAADLWFVGYTPEIVGTIWIGFDQPKTIVPNGESGEIAAPIWGRIMTRFGHPGPDWKVPPGVIVRASTDRVARLAEHCPTAPATRRVRPGPHGGGAGLPVKAASPRRGEDGGLGLCRAPRSVRLPLENGPSKSLRHVPSNDQTRVATSRRKARS